MADESTFSGGIFDACSRLHRASSGEWDSISADEREVLVSYLVSRQNDWEYRNGIGNDGYDAAVFALITATLNELKPYGSL